MRPVRKVLLVILALFLFPLGVHAALYASKERPASFREADWSSVGMLPEAGADREARFLVFTGRTGRWKGIFAVHSWVVFKRKTPPPGAATTWWAGASLCATTVGRPTGAGSAMSRACWSMCADPAAALIPRVKAAIADYSYNNFGDYRIWPGPNSNTFTARSCARCPQLEATLPSNAVGKDFRPHPYLGLTDSGTGIEASLWGLLGVKVGWVEGIEVNFLGLVAGLDLRHPAVKLPGFGRVGIDDGTAVAAPAPAK